jgi:hypothetical protein
MSVLPRKPLKGDRALQSIHDSLCEVIDYLPSLEVRGDNKTIGVNSHSSGKTIRVLSMAAPSAPGEAAAAPGEMYLAKVISGDGINGYTCNIYKNGLDNPPTEQSLVFLANGGSTLYRIPANTILYVQKIAVPVYGG